MRGGLGGHRAGRGTRPDPHGVPRPRRVPILQRSYPEWIAKGIARQSF